MEIPRPMLRKDVLDWIGITSMSTQYVNGPELVSGKVNAAPWWYELCPGLVAPALLGALNGPIVIPLAPPPVDQ